MPSSSPFPSDELLSQRAWVRALAFRLTRTDDGADDLEQDTWVTALQKAPKEQGSLRTWLTALVTNRWRDLVRGDVRRKRREALVATRDASPLDRDTTERLEAQKKLLDAVLMLSEPYKSAILSRFYEGLEFKDIARRRGIPESTARTHVARGIEQLRQTLRSDDPDSAGWRKALAPLLVPLGTPSRWSASASMGAVLGFVAIVSGTWWMFRDPREGQDVPSEVTSGANSNPKVSGTPPAADAAAIRTIPFRGDPVAPESSGASEPIRTKAGPSETVAVTVTVRDRAGGLAPRVSVSASEPLWGKERARGASLAQEQVTDQRGNATLQVRRTDWMRMTAVGGDEAAWSGILSLDTASRDGVELHLSRTVTVMGRVVFDGMDRPAARAHVELRVALQGAADTVRATRTDDAGAFVVPGVPERALSDEAYVVAHATGFLSGMAPVKPGAVEVTIALSSARRVRGRCVDDRGTPIAGVDISAVGFDGQGLSSAEGLFQLQKVPPHECTVLLHSNRFAPRRLVISKAGPSDLGDVVLEPGETLRGVVLLPNGSPASGAMVWVENLFLQQIFHQGGTDERGRFEFHHVAKGGHDVGAILDDPNLGQLMTTVRGVQPDGPPIALRLTQGQTVRIVFQHFTTGRALRIGQAKVTAREIGGVDKPLIESHGGDLEDVTVRVPKPGVYSVSLEVHGFETIEFSPVTVTEMAQTVLTGRLKARD